MKTSAIAMLLLPVFLCLSFNLSATGYTENQQLKKDERIVKQRVVEWADSVFYFHEDYRFENFHVHYTDEFYIVMLRSDMYKKKIDDLEKSKKKGAFQGTNDAYNDQLESLKRKYRRFQIIVDSFVLRVKYYEILFWSNIKTKHGYPVYYAHRFKLSNDLFVMAALIKSSIGNRSADNRIIYN